MGKKTDMATTEKAIWAFVVQLKEAMRFHVNRMGCVGFTIIFQNVEHLLLTQIPVQMPRLKREDFRARPPELRRGSKGRTQLKSTSLKSCRTHDIRNMYTNLLRGG